MRLPPNSAIEPGLELSTAPGRLAGGERSPASL
jgi:hypothetical protein